MEMSGSNQVQELIEDIKMVDQEKHKIFMLLRSVVFAINPSIQERVMYGGIMFSLGNDWGGIFVRKNHISFEFVLGVHLKDADGVLEGKGKLRRHIKLSGLRDIEDKKIGNFVKQSLENI